MKPFLRDKSKGTEKITLVSGDNFFQMILKFLKK